MIRKIIFTFLLISFFCSAGLLNAQITNEDALQGPERILNFDSTVVINPDSSLTVTEEIMVVAKGDIIKRGIYRDFPTIYNSKLGLSKTSFEVLSVKRDFEPEEFKIKSINNGKRLYIGKEDFYLPAGVYFYEITYKTNRQIGFFEDQDELYWNVTGNGWDFDIEKASATIIVPEGIKDDEIKVAAYTGPQGSTNQDFYSVVEDGEAYFSTTKSLMKNQGLTVAVSFPKGFLQEPTKNEKIMFFLKDNPAIVLGFLIFLLTLIYYIFQWKKYGDDPESESIVVQYNSPSNLSPMSLRYLTKMGFDKKILTTTIVSFATKGYLKINKLTSGNYKLEKIALDESALLEDEKVVAKEMFPGGVKEFFIRPSNYNLLQHLEEKSKKVLVDYFKEKFFVLNSKKFWIGIAISVIGLICLTLFLTEEERGIFIIITFLISMISSVLLGLFKNLKNLKIIIPNIIFLIFFGFITSSVFMDIILNRVSGLMFQFVIIIFFIFCVNALFWHLLKKRTFEGRKLQDNIEGFKLFLTMTEKDRMNFHNPPNKTPELFEKFLPYAIALNVENKWAEQFHDVFERMVSPEGSTYHPIWFNGDGFSYQNLSSSVSSFSNSFSSSISSSSVSPGSSSGFGGGGGGGSSGGGGGGGGGGGW